MEAIYEKSPGDRLIKGDHFIHLNRLKFFMHWWSEFKGCSAFARSFDQVTNLEFGYQPAKWTKIKFMN